MAGKSTNSISDNGSTIDAEDRSSSGGLDDLNGDSLAKLDAATLRARVLSQQSSLMEIRRQAKLEATRVAQQHEEELAKLRQDAEKARAEAVRIRQQAKDAAEAMSKEVFRAEYRAQKNALPRSVNYDSQSHDKAKERDASARFDSLETGPDTSPKATPAKGWRSPRLLLQMFALTVVVAVGVVAVSNSTVRLQRWADTPEPAPVADDLTSSVERSIREAGFAETKDRQFESSIKRLMQSADDYPDLSFQDLVVEVNQNRPASAHLTCPFEWNSAGQLALVLDLKTHSAHLLSASLDRCTEGIEKLALKNLAKP